MPLPSYLPFCLLYLRMSLLQEMNGIGPHGVFQQHRHGNQFGIYLLTKASRKIMRERKKERGRGRERESEKERQTEKGKEKQRETNGDRDRERHREQNERGVGKDGIQSPHLLTTS